MKNNFVVELHMPIYSNRIFNLEKKVKVTLEKSTILCHVVHNMLRTRGVEFPWHPPRHTLVKIHVRPSYYVNDVKSS